MDELIRGLVVGVALAAPVGPVGLIVIRLALTHGQGPAVTAGLGAAVADGIFGAIGGLGLTLIQTFITSNQAALASIGGVILIVLGIGTYRQTVAFDDRPVTFDSMVRDFTASFSLAITNPATMIAALGLFATLGTVNPLATPVRAAMLVGGVFVGSALWWITLSGLAVTLRQRMRQSLPWINRISAALFFLIGVGVLLSVFV